MKTEYNVPRLTVEQLYGFNIEEKSNLLSKAMAEFKFRDHIIYLSDKIKPHMKYDFMLMDSISNIEKFFSDSVNLSDHINILKKIYVELWNNHPNDSLIKQLKYSFNVSKSGGKEYLMSIPNFHIHVLLPDESIFKNNIVRSNDENNQLNKLLLNNLNNIFDDKAQEFVKYIQQVDGYTLKFNESFDNIEEDYLSKILNDIHHMIVRLFSCKKFNDFPYSMTFYDFTENNFKILIQLKPNTTVGGAGDSFFKMGNVLVPHLVPVRGNIPLDEKFYKERQQFQHDVLRIIYQR